MDWSDLNSRETDELDLADRLLKMSSPVNSNSNQKCTTSAKEKNNGSECFRGRTPTRLPPNSELPTIHSLLFNRETKSKKTDTDSKFAPILNTNQLRSGCSEDGSRLLQKPEAMKYCSEEEGNEQKRAKFAGNNEGDAQNANAMFRCSTSSTRQIRQTNSCPPVCNAQHSSQYLASNVENSPNCELAADALQEQERETAPNLACVISNEYFSVGLDDCILSSDTLGGALKLLELPCLLEMLDDDLAKLRANSKNKADHEIYFNDCVNKPFKKLSTKFHPDSVTRRGGTNEDIVMATEMQKSLNSVWSILKNLHKNFINGDFLGDEEFKYSTCSDVEVNTLNNEERLKHINNKISVELSWLTRIKHEEIIPYLNKFMLHSECCLQHFISKKEENFAHERKEAFLFFHICLEGYGNLVEALRLLFIDCCEDKELFYIKSSTEKTLGDTIKQLEVFKALKKNPDFTKIRSFKKLYNLAERDFVLPFVEYLYLISMCSSILNSERKNWFSRKWSDVKRYASDISYSFTSSIPPPGSSGSDDDEIGIQLKTDRIIKDPVLINTEFLRYCVKYNSESDKASKEKAIQILETFHIPHLGFNKKVAKASASYMISKLTSDLKKQFRPIKASKMYTMGQCMKDIKNLLGVFQTEFQEASKGIDEIKEEGRRNAEESRKKNEHLQNEIKELEEKEKRIKALLEKLMQNTVGTAQTSAQ